MFKMPQEVVLNRVGDFVIFQHQINCSPEWTWGAALFAPRGKSSVFAQSAFIDSWGLEVGLALFSSLSPILHT